MSRPIHFEIAHDQQPLAFDLHINEGVGRDKLRRVIEIGIEFAGGDKEGRDVRLCGGSSFHGWVRRRKLDRLEVVRRMNGLMLTWGLMTVKASSARILAQTQAPAWQACPHSAS